MSEKEIEKIIEMTINKSNKEYISLKKQFDELLSDYIELSRIEEKQEKVIEEVRTGINTLIHRTRFEEDFCEEDIELEKLLQILDKVKEIKNVQQ